MRESDGMLWFGGAVLFELEGRSVMEGRGGGVEIIPRKRR